MVTASYSLDNGFPLSLCEGIRDFIREIRLIMPVFAEYFEVKYINANRNI